ncbi:hypothetical protein VKT23_000200 [Stygiomarasmius scandens]|uniref:Uncharacterized protein n=1 Tax=Marasmiellus scandens TaxID=2682957 RepID=A0ABR1K9E7_9AGAR
MPRSKGIYPTAIIVLAAIGQTFEYMFEDITPAHSVHVNNPEITQVSGIITFAPRNTESTMTMGVSTATSQSSETRASSTATRSNS